MKSDFFKFRLRLWGLVTAGAAVAAAVSVAGFFGRWAWWLDIWSHFRVQYTVGFAVVALCYVLGRKKRWALAGLCFTVLNIIPVIAFLLPPARDVGPCKYALRAVLANVNTRTGDPQKVMAFLKEQNPDIIVLEEINDEWIKALSEIVSQYDVQVIESRRDNFGIALLSRQEAVTTRVVAYGQAKVPSIIATLLLEGRLLTVIATHPLPPAGSLYSSLRNEQLELLARDIQTLEGPVLLLGDLNTTPWSCYYRSFIRDSGLTNASEGRGIYPTWPTFAVPLLIPIDHALHTDDIAVLNKSVGPNLGSDHYPVIVDFALTELIQEEKQGEP